MGPQRGKRLQRAPDSPVASPSTPYDRWVWWPNKAGQRSRAQEEFLDLPPQAQGELTDRMKRFLEGRTRYKDVDDLGDGIKELRIRLSNNHYRVLLFVDGRDLVALTCFYKNQRATPTTDLDRAKRRMRTY